MHLSLSLSLNLPKATWQNSTQTKKEYIHIHAINPLHTHPHLSFLPLSPFSPPPAHLLSLPPSFLCFSWLTRLMGSASLDRRLQILRTFFLLLTFVLLLLGQHCQGSRPHAAARNVFKIRPRPPEGNGDIGHFLGFLPRGFPIPASGPSRKHNAIGLQSLQASPWISPSPTLFLYPYTCKYMCFNLRWLPWFSFFLSCFPCLVLTLSS